MNGRDVGEKRGGVKKRKVKAEKIDFFLWLTFVPKRQAASTACL
jgi:hypothetical protein